MESEVTSSAPAQLLLKKMTLAEKIGQLSQLNFTRVDSHLKDSLKAGELGSLLNVVDRETTNELQRIAVEQSRLGIPLLIGRDVIHGFKTVFPIPLGQAASWNPEVVRQGASIAAEEAAAVGINWTFAPMLDVCRDPRWGRIAECLGEDPWLASHLAGAMIEGFQGDSLNSIGSIAACAKHFAGYGACEAGRDYATTNIPENELRNVFLPPFEAAIEAGVATIMASFSDLNGLPASANPWLMQTVLRDEWGFDGFVVSDWESVSQLAVHGVTANDRESALAAASAGIDMEMASRTFHNHLADLVNDGLISEARIDAMVIPILRLKFRLGLFDNPYTQPTELAAELATDKQQENLEAARDSARQSLVLLKNQHQLLPLKAPEICSLAVIGPLADDDYEQLGTWIFDGDPALSKTPLDAIGTMIGPATDLHVCAGLSTSRDRSHDGFEQAVQAAHKAEIVLMFLGEESILSGEAHSRADIGLPGAQEQLVAAVAATGKPIIAVILAGRPLTLGPILPHVSALLYAWHPGSMGGPAIADILFGRHHPTGRLPVTFPRMVGQIPIYHSQKNTGKPATPESFTPMDQIEPRALQTSVGNTSFHMDAGYTPQFPFGFGLTYTEFTYTNIQLSSEQVAIGGAVEVHFDLTNTGPLAGTETAQLYVRDLVGSVTRPVRELKGYQRVSLEPGETRRVSFSLTTKQLAFFDRYMNRVTEPGQFHVFVGGNADASLQAGFEVTV